MVDSDILKYFAQLAIKDISSQDSSEVVLPNNIYKKLNSFPIIDYLHEAARNKNNAVQLIKLLINSDNKYKVIFGINLCKSFINDNNILNLLEKLYEYSTDPQIKIEIIFRLSEVKGDYEQINEYLSYVISNWEAFFSLIPEWIGDLSPLEVAKKRIEDKSIPDFKKWIYILISLKEKNKTETMNMLKKIDMNGKIRRRIEQLIESNYDAKSKCY